MTARYRARSPRAGDFWGTLSTTTERLIRLQWRSAGGASNGTSTIRLTVETRAFEDARIRHRVAIGRGRRDRHFEDARTATQMNVFGRVFPDCEYHGLANARVARSGITHRT